LLAGLNYVNIHTTTNGGGEIRGQLIPVLNRAPTIACPAPATLDCASPNGTMATVTVNVGDEDGDALEVIWKVNGTAVQTNQIASPSSTNAAVTLEATFGFGESEVVVSVSDGVGAAVSCTTRITVRDTTPPVVSSVRATPGVLWPPNHKMVPVQVQVQATDACAAVKSKIASVTSDEPVNGTGDGNTSPDWVITGDLSVELRAERSGPGNGRVYTIHLEIGQRCPEPATRRRANRAKQCAVVTSAKSGTGVTWLHRHMVTSLHGYIVTWLHRSTRLPDATHVTL
jgi:hypothetical protein